MSFNTPVDSWPDELNALQKFFGRGDHVAMLGHMMEMLEDELPLESVYEEMKDYMRELWDAQEKS